MPFFYLHKKWKKKWRKNYDKYIRLPTFQLLISLLFATEKRKERNRYHPAWKGRQDILSNVKPVECFQWLYFRVWDLCPWQQTAGKAEKRVSPAFYSKYILWGRWWWGTHSSVWRSRWHGGSCVRHCGIKKTTLDSKMLCKDAQSLAR